MPEIKVTRGRFGIVSYPIIGYNASMTKTMFLPGFSHRLCGRRAPAAASQVQRQTERLDGLAALVARFIPAAVFAPAQGQRERVFTPWVTFVSFLGQVLTRGSSCREALRRVQAWRVAGKRPRPDDSTSAYCQARARLPLDTLRAAHDQLGDWIGRRTKEAWRWCGRPVKVLDGCGVSMPDTAANRALWPYAAGQKPGCGFPTAQLVGLFCLATGRLVRFALDTWKAHEIRVARRLVEWVGRDEVLLTDRGFCGRAAGPPRHASCLSPHEDPARARALGPVRLRRCAHYPLRGQIRDTALARPRQVLRKDRSKSTCHPLGDIASEKARRGGELTAWG